jgi:hypothetical protein
VIEQIEILASVVALFVPAGGRRPTEARDAVEACYEL